VILLLRRIISPSTSSSSSSSFVDDLNLGTIILLKRNGLMFYSIYSWDFIIFLNYIKFFWFSFFSLYIYIYFICDPFFISLSLSLHHPKSKHFSSSKSQFPWLEIRMIIIRGVCIPSV
jgi:hypothetical protein